MESFISNLSGSVRRETRGGRDYLVAPMTLIVEGVLNGSRGPMMYPRSEIRKTANAWDSIPITTNHPVEGGSYDPESGIGIGVLKNARCNGKLTAEGWFDVELVQRADERIYNALILGRKLELSTGLQADGEPAPSGSEFGGKPYNFIARNYRPDHLAILPDSVGACSLRDGCGVLNASNAEKHFAAFDVPHRYLDADGKLLRKEPPPQRQPAGERGLLPFGTPGQGGYLTEEKTVTNEDNTVDESRFADFGTPGVGSYMRGE